MALAVLVLIAPTPARSQQALPRAKPEDVGVSSERLRRIDEVMKRHIDEHHIDGDLLGGEQRFDPAPQPRLRLPGEYDRGHGWLGQCSPLSMRLHGQRSGGGRAAPRLAT